MVSRIRFGRLPGAFRCRLGPPSGWPRHRPLWRLRRARAVWLHDVLVIQSGLLQLGMTTRCPTIAQGATSVLDRTALVGPFLTAAVAGLPRAPRDHDV